MLVLWRDDNGLLAFLPQPPASHLQKKTQALIKLVSATPGVTSSPEGHLQTSHTQRGPHPLSLMDLYSAAS